MPVILFLLIIVLSFVIALALDLGGLGASIIYLLLMTVTSLIVSGIEKKKAA